MKQVKTPKKLAQLLISSSLTLVASTLQATVIEVDCIEDEPLEMFSLINDSEDSNNCGCGSGGVCNSGCNGSC